MKFVVFFFKQKTAYEMRISDWSSDVCSSDLPGFPQVRCLPDLACRERVLPLSVRRPCRCGVQAIVRAAPDRTGRRNSAKQRKHGKCHAGSGSQADAPGVGDDPDKNTPQTSEIAAAATNRAIRSEEHTSELQSL